MESETSELQDAVTENHDGDETELRKTENMSLCSKWFACFTKIRVTIEPAIFCIFLAANLCDVIITNLLMVRTCEVELHFNKSECSLLGSNTDEAHRIEALVQPHAALYMTGKSLIVSILPAVMSMYLGPWSDNNGRKCVLLSPMLGLFLTYMMHSILSSYSNLHPAYLLLASLPFSICGGYINLISASYSYISDISLEEDRALRLGIVEASLYLGLLVGIVSSYQVFNIDVNYGYTITCSVGSVISLIAFLYSTFFVPESIRPSEESHRIRTMFQFKHIKEMFVTTFKERENYGRILILLTLFAMTTTIIAMDGNNNLMYLFTRLRFGWNLKLYTTWAAVSIATDFIGLTISCVLLSKVFNVSDGMLVVISSLTKTVQCIVYAVAPPKGGQWMYAGQLVGLLGGVSGPGLRSVLSKIVPGEDVGKVFFFATSLESLFPLAFTPVYTLLYNSTMNILPGAFLLLSGSLYFVDFIFTSFIYYMQRHHFSPNYALIEENK